MIRAYVILAGIAASFIMAGFILIYTAEIAA